MSLLVENMNISFKIAELSHSIYTSAINLHTSIFSPKEISPT